MNNTEEKLEGCPFCNGEGAVKFEHRPYCVVVVCQSCGSSGVRKQSIEEAQYCWNLRPQAKEINAEELANTIQVITLFKLSQSDAEYISKSILSKYRVVERSDQHGKR